jgi:hypothetical protein
MCSQSSRWGAPPGPLLPAAASYRERGGASSVAPTGLHGLPDALNGGIPAMQLRPSGEIPAQSQQLE